MIIEYNNSIPNVKPRLTKTYETNSMFKVPLNLQSSANIYSNINQAKLIKSQMK